MGVYIINKFFYQEKEEPSEKLEKARRAVEEMGYEVKGNKETTKDFESKKHEYYNFDSDYSEFCLTASKGTLSFEQEDAKALVWRYFDKSLGEIIRRQKNYLRCLERIFEETNAFLAYWSPDPDLDLLEKRLNSINPSEEKRKIKKAGDRGYAILLNEDIYKDLDRNLSKMFPKSKIRNMKNGKTIINCYHLLGDSDPVNIEHDSAVEKSAMEGEKHR